MGTRTTARVCCASMIPDYATIGGPRRLAQQQDLVPLPWDVTIVELAVPSSLDVSLWLRTCGALR